MQKLQEVSLFHPPSLVFVVQRTNHILVTLNGNDYTTVSQKKNDQIKWRVLKITQVKRYVLKNDQLQCMTIAVDLFLNYKVHLVDFSNVHVYLIFFTRYTLTCTLLVYGGIDFLTTSAMYSYKGKVNEPWTVE